MTFKGFLRICCAFLLLASAFIVPADAQQGPFTITLTTSGPNSGAVSVRWSSGNQGGNSICNAPLGGATCTISGIPAGAAVLISANQPGTAGVITDPAFCNLKTTCTFAISANMTAHVGFGDVAGVTFQTFTMQLAGQGEGYGGADNNGCQNFDPLQYSACATHYATGSVVNLTAFRIPNSAFVGFSGGTTPEAQAGCTTPNAQCSFALNSDASVTATFARLTSIAVAPSSQTTTVGGSVNFTAVGTFVNGASFQRNLTNDVGYWKFKAPMATARFGHAAAALNGRLYVLGGVRNTLFNEFCPSGNTANGYCVNANGSVNTTPVASVEAYDPVTNAWTAETPMPLGARASHAAAVSGSTLYVLGGSTSNNVTVASVEAFDGTTWSQVASLSSPRRLLGAAAVNGIIYAVGGRDDNGNALNTVEAFDTANPGNGWVLKASLPTARHSLGVVALNGQVYAIGGNATGGSNLSVVEVYSPATNTWTQKQSMPSGRSLFGAAAIGNQIYVVGGNANGFRGETFAYDTASNQWFNRAFLPQLVQGQNPNQTFQNTDRAELAAGVIDRIVYAVGGDLVPPPNQQPPNTLATPILQAFTDSVTWQSGNINVATVSQNGQATGRSVGGPVPISAGVGSLTCIAGSTCGSLTVTAPPPPSIQVFVSQSGVDTQVGNTTPFACITFTDPSPNPGPWTATVDFGDGTGVQTIPSNSIGTPQQLCGAPPPGPGSPNGAFRLSHSYATAGNYTAHITVNGQGGITGSNNLQVRVHAPQPPPECAQVTFNITGNNYPFPTVNARIYDLSTNPPTLEDTGSIPIGSTTFDVNPGSFRVAFDPPAGYLALPASVDVNVQCNDHLSFNVLLRPIDTTPPVVSVAPSSGTLWPPNGKMVPIVISGTIADAESGIVAGSASFHVVDEYGTVEPGGPVSVAPDGSYSFTVMLEARRSGDDQDGRTYQVVVTASNNDGGSTSTSTVVSVPHDQGH